MFSFAQLSPCGLGFRLCAGLGRVEGLLVCLQDARRQPSQKTTVNQAIAEFRRAPGYGCLNMGGCRDQQNSRPRQAKKTRSAGVRYARYRFFKRHLLRALSCAAAPLVVS